MKEDRMSEADLRHLRAAFALARRAREHGNHPFGALLVDAHNNVLLSAENTVVTGRDCTGHAETNLVRMASARCSAGLLATCTLYTSTEPCAMCAGAIHWGNIGRMVYGLSAAALYAIAGPSPQHLALPCREVFARSERPIEVLGPLLEDEARDVHAGFWTSRQER
jgi:tRNA(Arg) A34 adenosine deaminase TadA